MMPPNDVGDREIRELVRAMDASTTATIEATKVQVQIMTKLDGLIAISNRERKWLYGLIAFLILAVLAAAGIRISALAQAAQSLGLAIP